MSDIKPTERELKLVNHIDGGLGDHCENHGKVKVCNCQSVKNWLLSLVMLHTRYEGKDAQRWAAECQLAADKGEQFRQRAEIAKTRIAELEAENAGICRWVNEHCKLTGVSPELEVIRKYIEANNAAIAEAVSKTRQECADVLRDAKCRCHELVNLHNGIHCEDVKQTIKDIDSILALSIPPARPAESRSLNRGC
jgi:hypothetical protein